MPWSKTREFDSQAVAESPRSPGVYAFHQKGVVIYYGVVSTGEGIQGRLQQHLTNERNPCLCLARERPVSVSWYPTDEPEPPLNRLLDRFRAQRNRLPRCNQYEQGRLIAGAPLPGPTLSHVGGMQPNDTAKSE